jgi:hypothetical protein
LAKRKSCIPGARKRWAESPCTRVVMVLRIGVCVSFSIPASRPDAPLGSSGGDTQFRQEPLCQDNIGEQECDSPNPIGHVPSLLSADSKFTQKRHHRAPGRQSRVNQIQSNKSREEVPVRACVVPKCQGQQNKTASDLTKCTFYGHDKFSL